MQTQNQQRITTIDDELTQMETTIKKQEADFLNYLNTGFLTRIEAMNNLIKDNSAFSYRLLSLPTEIIATQFYGKMSRNRLIQSNQLT